MTPSELREIREARGLTREELASELGDVTASTINKWERDMHAIPAWVGEKLLRHTTVELPLEELQQLMSWAIAHGKNFETILAEALNEYLAARGLSKDHRLKQHSAPVTAAASPPTPAARQIPPKPTAKIAKLPRPTTPEPEQKVAEEAPPYVFTKRKAK